MTNAHIKTLADRLAAPPWNGRAGLTPESFVAHMAELSGGWAVNPRVGDELAVFAYVNAGFWKAVCLLGSPLDRCLGVEEVDPARPLFFCLSCHNGGSYEWRMVRFPEPEERAAIEAVLLARPAPGTRNWWSAPARGAFLGLEVAETLEELKAENLTHADPITLPGLGGQGEAADAPAAYEGQ